MTETPQTSVTNEKPDWFVGKMQQLIPDKLNEMHAQGMYANNFSIQEPEAYWSKKDIQASFTSPDGNVHKDLFDKSYALALGQYKIHRDTEMNLVNFADQSPNITAQRVGFHTPTPLIFKTKEDPQGRNYQSGYAFGDGFSQQTKSIKETALQTGVRQDNGTYLSTKDFSGKAKFAMSDKGGYLFNEDGRPYLVPLKDGEQLHNWDQVYDPHPKVLGVELPHFLTAEGIGAYGHDYSWSNVAASIAKNPVNFLSQTVDDLVEYGRGFMGFWGLDTKESDKAVNNIENWAKGIRIPTTEGNQGDFYNLENVVDLSQQVFYQLGAMAAVGATITALTKNPKAGSIGAKLFMTAISAGSAAEIARDNGLSKKESAVLLALESAAYYPLMSLSEAALGRLGTQESRAAMKESINKATNNGVLIKEIASNPSKATIRTVFNNLREGGKSLAYTLENKAPIVVGAASEALEETAEQGVDLSGRLGYNAYDYTKDDQHHPFPIDWSNELAAAGQAATGGAIGGSAAHAVFSRLLNNHPETAASMHDMVMDGKEETIRRFVKDMADQGRLDHNWIQSNGKMTTPEAGNSKNDEAKNVLNGIVDYLVQLRDTSGIKNLYKNNKEAAKAVFADAVNASSVGKDAADLNTKILKITDELEKAKTATTSNPENISALTEELKINQEALGKIVKGEFVPDYVTEGLYNTLAQTTADPSLSKDRLSGKEFNALMNSLPDQHKASQEEFKAAQEKQETIDKSATIEKPEGVTPTRLEQLRTEAQKAYATAHEAVVPHLDVLSNATEQGVMPESLSPEGEAIGRNDELAVLKNNVLPALTQKVEGESKKDTMNRKAAHQAASQLIKAGETLRKLEEMDTQDPLQAPKAVEGLLNMTEGKGALMTGSPSTIASKIDAELALRDSSKNAGISMYSNTPQLKSIKDSIEARIAQVRALGALGQQVATVRELHKLPVLPEMDPQDLPKALTVLNQLLGVTNSLLAESENNTASADLKVAQAVSALLGHTVDYLNNLSLLLVNTEFEGVQKIVSASRDAIHKALAANDTVQTQALLTQAETSIFNTFSDKKETILAVLAKEEPSEFSRRAYDYARGILTLSSADFWNAYQSVLTNSNAGMFSPSDEHSIIVKQAVQGLMADEYNPPATPHLNGIKHHNSVFVEGRGGTAKTKTIIPLIAGVVQKLTGGKVYLTAAQDVNDYKRTTLLSAVEDYYRISDKQLGIDLANSSLDILKFLDTPGATTGVNLIVYDEATLLSSIMNVNGAPVEGDLQKIQARVNKLNTQRKENGEQLLKILYTGDTLQNSIGVDKSNPDSRALGIDDVQRHVIQRTPALTFSFRQSNQQLVLFSSYLESIQKETGASRPFSTEYRQRDGVQIHQDYEGFVSNVVSYINSLTKQTRLHEAVYITDKGRFETDQRILDSGILVLTSEQAQGREWPIVFFDPKNTTLFTEGFTNLGVKKDYYTAITRASSYLLTHVTPGQGITSSEGTVNKIRPLLPENATRVATIDKVNQILGGLAAPVSHVAFDYKKGTYLHQDADFPGFEEETTEKAPITGTIKTPTPSPIPNIVTPKALTPLTQADNLIKYLTSINRKDLVSLHTFFTNELHSFDEQMALKRKAIYNKDIQDTVPYFISINRIGSPGYENVLRNDPEFKGAYAVFIEAGDAGNNVVLGTLSTPGLDEAIRQGNLLQGKPSVRLPLSSEFLSEAQNYGTTVVNQGRRSGGKGSVKSVGSIKDASKGIRFGKPFITVVSSSENNVKGKPIAKAGEIFIPTSFYYTPEQIGQVMAANTDSEYITHLPVRTTYVPFQEIVNRLDKYIEDGKFNFNAEGDLAGRMYDTFWSHNAQAGYFATQDKRESRLSTAFRSLRDQTPASNPLHKFLDYYVDKEITLTPEEEIENADSKTPVDKKPKISNNARYFLKHYMEAKAKGKATALVNFENAVRGLSSHPYFKLGFEFNPRTLYGSTDKTVTAHVQARNLPEEIYNTYLEVEADYVSPPIIQVPLNQLVASIKQAIPSTPIEPETANQGNQPTPGGQSQVEYSTPTISQSGVSMTVDQNPVSDGAVSEKVYEDDPDILDTQEVSLIKFQQDWFSKPGYSSMFPETVRRFRREFMNDLFNLNGEDGAQPFLVHPDEAIRNRKERNKRFETLFTGDFLDKLDPVRSLDSSGTVRNPQADRDTYIRGVISRELPFLLKKYFPAITEIENPDTKKKEYRYQSTHYKSRSFDEKESFNLLAEGMTDMVKTQLYNTPMLRKNADGSYATTGSYFWEGSIEALVDAAQGAASKSEIAAHLKESQNQAVHSVYMRFFHNAPYKVDGKMVWPIGKVPNAEVFKMRDSVGIFAVSGQIFNFTKVDLDEQRLISPWTAWGAPNTVREVSHQAVNQVAATQGKFIVRQTDGSMIIGSHTVKPSSLGTPTDADVLTAIHSIGLTNFNAKHLKEVQEEDYNQFNVTPAGDIAQKVNKKIIDELIIPTMKMMADERFVDSGLNMRLNTLYDAIVRSSGVSNMLSQIDVASNKSYRLRWGAPVYRVKTQLQEIITDPTSVLANNMLVKNQYTIEEIPVKNGFESEDSSKHSKTFSADESADFDIIWSFAKMLKDSHANSKEYNLATFTPLVWSDSPTDPHMIVRSQHKNGYFRPAHDILKDLFESRKSFYNMHSSKILNTWNEFLGDRYKATSLSGLSTWLSSNKIPIDQVEKHPGMVNNLYYVAVDGNASIKPSLIADVNFYAGNNLADFIRKTKTHYDAFVEFAKNSKDGSGISLEERLGKVIDGKSSEQMMQAFYYNWLAFSSEFANLMAGPTQLYKGDTSGEYIDNTKRNKLLMANRSAQLFRDKGWEHEYNLAKKSGLPLSEELKYEGRKLPRKARIAYVRDIKKVLTIPSVDPVTGKLRTKNQEVYDGATFVLPTTRIMQKHSNGGSHGIYVGSVMKNVTTAIDNNKGIPTGIKNAEFLITPEIMRKGTEMVANIVRRSYQQPFKNIPGNAWDVLTGQLGLAEDLSNAEWSHFEKLMDFLVENGEQDSLVTEIAPDSSVKMARKATNSLTETTPFVTEENDLVNKGTQLDASHGTDEIGDVRGSQIINAMSMGWTNPGLLKRMYAGLAEIAKTKIQEWTTQSPKERLLSLKKIATETFGKRGDMSYASRVTAADNNNNFSIDDRQLVTSILRNLNASLSKEAVLLDFAGGQYIVHPTNGLVQVYDVVRDGKKKVVLKTDLTAEEKKTAKGRDLIWNREDGYAEILLPASMRSKFGITDAEWKQKNLTMEDITPEFFMERMEKKSARKAVAQYKSFQKTLSQLTTRIPATGMHSAVATRIVGFMDESENSIFVPAELLFVQGADQDADKGVNFSYEVVGGLVPQVEENLELKDKHLFSDKLRKKARLAGIKNLIVDSMEKLLLIPQTLTSRNTPVDNSKEELDAIAKTVESTYKFERDSYLSHLQMREINQAGMALRGIFSNAMKAYDVMIIALNSKGIDPVTVGLSTSPVVRERIGALVNAAVDNAKDQIMGKLGIGNHNANMVSYLVMKGMDFKAIHEFLLRYAPQMEQMKRYSRYDTNAKFRASIEWKEFPELASIYYLGNEVSSLSRFALNRRLPSDDVEMIAYRKGVESFINGQYKAFKLGEDFKLIPFLESDEYAMAQIEKYDTLKGRSIDEIQRSEFNILRMLHDAPHIEAYMQVYRLSNTLASESKLYKVSSRLADDVLKTTAQLDEKNQKVLAQMKDFVYGLFIDQYLQKAENPTNHDLTTPAGRAQFVSNVGSVAYAEKLKAAYPTNAFVDSLAVVPDTKRNWNDSSLLRIQDLQQTSEEIKMQIQADFNALPDNVRKTLVMYNLITRQTKFSKDSFGSILSPGDKADFNRFLDNNLDIGSYNYTKLADKWDSYYRHKKDAPGVHNAIPYSAFTIEQSVETKPAVEIAKATPVTSGINFIEDNSSNYTSRTAKNASADATIAIAYDFKSPGEIHTKKEVERQGKKYIMVKLPHSSSVKSFDFNTPDVKNYVSRVVDDLNSVKARTLNIAGNGLYTFLDEAGYNQDQLDTITYGLLKAITEHPNLETPILSIITGGQTGADEAGAKAAVRLGISTIVRAPKGWKFRNVNHTDISNEEAFKSRFENRLDKTDILRAQQGLEPSGTQSKSMAEDAAAMESSQTETISQIMADMLNTITDSKYYSTKTPLDVVKEAIDSILDYGGTNQIETATLKALKQEIQNRKSPDSNEVDNRSNSCAI